MGKTELDPKRGGTAASEPKTLSIKTKAVDELNEALKAAERHLFELNLGVSAEVLLSSEVEEQEDEHGQVYIEEIFDFYLAWTRQKQWRLVVETRSHGDQVHIGHVLEASPELRKEAARKLPELLKELHAAVDREVNEYRSAADIARSFASGAYDHAHVDWEPLARRAAQAEQSGSSQEVPTERGEPKRALSGEALADAGVLLRVGPLPGRDQQPKRSEPERKDQLQPGDPSWLKSIPPQTRHFMRAGVTKRKPESK